MTMTSQHQHKNACESPYEWATMCVGSTLSITYSRCAVYASVARELEGEKKSGCVRMCVSVEHVQQIRRVRLCGA